VTSSRNLSGAKLDQNIGTPSQDGSIAPGLSRPPAVISSRPVRGDSQEAIRFSTSPCASRGRWNSA
jgi:hypothetical protein